jgi:hypothetical protein
LEDGKILFAHYFILGKGIHDARDMVWTLFLLVF